MINRNGNYTYEKNMTINGTTSVYNFKMDKAAFNGYVLTSDGSGNAAWQPGSQWNLEYTTTDSGGNKTSSIERYNTVTIADSTARLSYVSVRNYGIDVMSDSFGQINLNTRSSSSVYPLLGFNRKRGTVSTPTDALNGDVLGQMQFSGNYSNAAFIKVTTTEDHTSLTNSGGIFEIGVRSNGLVGTSPTPVRFSILNSGNVRFNNTYSFPLTDGSSSQVLSTDGSGNVSWNSFIKGDGTIPLTNNWNAGSYTITTNKLISGTDSSISGVLIGRGGGANVSNTTMGVSSLIVNTTGDKLAAFGAFSLRNNIDGLDNTGFGFGVLYTNISGDDNTGVGTSVLYVNTASDNTGVGSYCFRYNTIGHSNTGVGRSSLYYNETGSENATLGKTSLYNNIIGNRNIGVGALSGSTLHDGITGNTASNNSIFIGYDTKSLTATSTNQIVIGYAALGNGSNTTTIGNTSMTDIYLHGKINLKNTSTLVTGSVTQTKYILINISGVDYKLLLAD